MVNNTSLRIVSVADCLISVEKDNDGNDRKIISNGPVYSLSKTQKQINTYDVKVVTAQGLEDQFNHSMDEKQLRKFILALLTKHYKKSERCLTSEHVTMVEYDVDCDAYSMKWNREELRQSNNGKSFYIKFGFSECDSGCLIISIHP